MLFITQHLAAYYSVSPIYRGRVYRGIGYIAVACWTPFFGAQERDIFREIAVTPWIQFAGDTFSRNLLTAIAFVLGPRETIFRETNSSLPVNAGWNTCCAVVSHARRSIDTSIVSQSRVQLIQCRCKSRLQIANLGINNAFLIKSTLFTSAILSRHRDSSAANQERVIGRYSKVPLVVYAHQNKAVLMTQNRLIRPQISEITATSVSIDSIDTNLIQKPFNCHLNFRKCTLTVEYIAVLRVATLIFCENKMAGRRTPQNTWLQVDYLCTDDFNLEFYRAVL